MPGEVGVRRRGVPHRRVRSAHRVRDGLALDQRVAETFERHRAGDLAGPVTTHAVRDGEQLEAPVDEVAVLVALAHHPGVGGGSADDLHRTSSISV